MALCDTRKALTREKRSGALSHFHGDLASLEEEICGAGVQQRVRTFSQSGPGEILYALRLLGGIEDAALIVHGAVGCAASGAFFTAGAQAGGAAPAWYSTNLNERDTILGGEAKLREALLRAGKETSAKLIFIVGTPITAINNDEVNSLIEELQEELAPKIIYIDVNGFRTKNALSGYDTVFHALLKNLVEPRREVSTPFVNLLSSSENPRNLAAITELLRRLDISCNILPRFSSSRGICASGSALSSFSLNDSENEYMAAGLEESFNVPFVRTPVPIGTAATRTFLEKLALRCGKEAQAQKLIEEEERGAALWVSEKPLAGKRLFVEMDLHAAASFSACAGELGAQVSGMLIPSLDAGNLGKIKELAALPRTLPLLIGQGQQFEIANILAKHPADFYVGKAENAALAVRFGALPLVTDSLCFYGYAGIGELLRRIRQLEQGGGFFEFPQRESETRYTGEWLKKSGNWHVKVEVK
jgi:nitrogenase molybdenum-iron protein alpha chain